MIHFFWKGSDLTDLENGSLESFLNLGYKCTLWTYGDVKNIPNGVIIRDANEIMELNNAVDITHFSDLFRLILLYKKGGTWSDLDNILLKELPESEYIFSAHHVGYMNNNILRCPMGCEFLKEVIEENKDTWVSLEVGELNFKYLYGKIFKFNLNEYLYSYRLFNSPLQSVHIKSENYDPILLHLTVTKHYDGN